MEKTNPIILYDKNHIENNNIILSILLMPRLGVIIYIKKKCLFN